MDKISVHQAQRIHTKVKTVDIILDGAPNLAGAGEVPFVPTQGTITVTTAKEKRFRKTVSLSRRIAVLLRAERGERLYERPVKTAGAMPLESVPRGLREALGMVEPTCPGYYREGPTIELSVLRASWEQILEDQRNGPDSDVSPERALVALLMRMDLFVNEEVYQAFIDAREAQREPLTEVMKVCGITVIDDTQDSLASDG